jgi:predicted lipoprotein with Yx(FWY)xxD motif
MRRLPLTLALLAVPALLVAGCGGGSSGGGYGGGGSSSSTKAPASSSGGATVGVRKTGLGTILVDSSGRTVYLFEKDTGDRSTCSGACAEAWPPVTATGKPSAGTGVSAAKLGTSMRADGTREVTYAGHPLYTYAGDTAPGATTGQGLDQFGAEWYVLSPAGTKVEDAGS